MSIKLYAALALMCLAVVAQSKPTAVEIAAPVAETETETYNFHKSSPFAITSSIAVGSGAIDLCHTCIEFAGEALQTLLNLILNKVVAGSCNKLCGALENATHSKPIGTTCEIICELEGIKAFVNWIEHADLSPIYDCQNLNLCKYNDHGDAEITSFVANPTSGPQGTTFELDLTWTTKNGTGTGEIRFDLQTMDHVQLSIPTVYIPDTTVADSFKSTLSVDTKPDPNCDPSQQQCENWLYGKYNLTVSICEGECGDTKHPHSSLYASANVSFDITRNGPPGPPPGPPGPPPPPPAPGSNPWADPLAGPCPNAEEAVQVTNVKGSFCSPVCSTSVPCPAAPSGVTAQPQCALEKSGSTTPTQCALLCKPGNSCPAKASCKNVQPGVGICTFDN